MQILQVKLAKHIYTVLCVFSDNLGYKIVDVQKC